MFVTRLTTSAHAGGVKSQLIINFNPTNRENHMQFQVNIKLDPNVMNNALSLLKVLVIRGTTIAALWAAISSQLPVG